jgi:hypothetical protein
MLATAAAELEFAAPPAAPAVDESLMPRWRRPSLQQVRKIDPTRVAPTAAPALSFEAAGVVPLADYERRKIGYRLVRLMDSPDELRSVEVGTLDQGDEVQLLDRYGVYWLVLCPDGRQGWIHRMTLVDAPAPSAAVGETEPMPQYGFEEEARPADGQDNLLEAYMEARRDVLYSHDQTEVAEPQAEPAAEPTQGEPVEPDLDESPDAADQLADDQATEGLLEAYIKARGDMLRSPDPAQTGAEGEALATAASVSIEPAAEQAAEANTPVEPARRSRARRPRTPKQAVEQAVEPTVEQVVEPTVEQAVEPTVEESAEPSPRSTRATTKRATKSASANPVPVASPEHVDAQYSEHRSAGSRKAAAASRPGTRSRRP